VAGVFVGVAVRGDADNVAAIDVDVDVEAVCFCRFGCGELLPAESGGGLRLKKALSVCCWLIAWCLYSKYGMMARRVAGRTRGDEDDEDEDLKVDAYQA
jgi:hypothetical protein